MSKRKTQIRCTLRPIMVKLPKHIYLALVRRQAVDLHVGRGRPRTSYKKI